MPLSRPSQRKRERRWQSLSNPSCLPTVELGGGGKNSGKWEDKLFLTCIWGTFFAEGEKNGGGGGEYVGGGGGEPDLPLLPIHAAGYTQRGLSAIWLSASLSGRAAADIFFWTYVGYEGGYVR